MGRIIDNINHKNDSNMSTQLFTFLLLLLLFACVCLVVPYHIISNIKAFRNHQTLDRMFRDEH